MSWDGARGALIGYSGYVGGTLLRQRRFEHQYRSTDIGEIAERSFDLVVCAGAPAQKWLANRDPEADRRRIADLMAPLETVRCGKFVLISTIDVFGRARGVDERAPVDVKDLHPYGLHRRELEEFVERRFPGSLIVRLPGLVGPGLRKNVVFDLLNDNNVHLIDSRAVFQFYPMVNLWFDVEVALKADLRLLHLTAEPITVADVALQGFGRRFENALDGSPPAYDMRTLHAALFGSDGHYQYRARESIQAIRAYAQSERPSKVVA